MFLDFVESFARLMRTDQLGRRWFFTLYSQLRQSAFAPSSPPSSAAVQLGAAGPSMGFKLLEPRPQQLRWRRQFEETKNKTRRTSWKIKRTGKTTLEHLRKSTWRKYPI